eukprot:403334203
MALAIKQQLNSVQEARLKYLKDLQFQGINDQQSKNTNNIIPKEEIEISSKKYLIDILENEFDELNTQKKYQHKAREEVFIDRVQLKKNQIKSSLMNLLLSGHLKQKDHDQKLQLLDEKIHILQDAVQNNEYQHFENYFGLQLAPVQSQDQTNQNALAIKSAAQDPIEVIRKLQVEKKLRKQRKLQILKALQEREAQEKLELQREQDIQEKQREFQRQQQLKTLQQRLQEREELRKQFQEETSLKVKEMEQNQRRLQEIKEVMAKPLYIEQINKHERKYQKLKNKYEREQKKQREQSIEAEREHIENLRHKPDLSFIEERKKQELIDLKKKQEFKTKISSYAEYVREMYYPKISEDKKQELESLKEQLNANKPKVAQNHYYKVERSQNNYDFSQDKSLSSEFHNQSVDYSSGEHKYRSKIRKVNLKTNKSVIQDDTTSSQKSKSQIIDFLKEQRIKRAEQESQGINFNRNYFNDFTKDSDISSFNSVKRIEQLNDRAKIIEERAQRQEKFLKSSNHKKGDSVSQTIAVNEMYIDAIQAKLKILDQI